MSLPCSPSEAPGLCSCSAWGLTCSLVSSFRHVGPRFPSRHWVEEAQPLSAWCYPRRKCVREWEEPHDSALYCIRSDGNHMIASGSSYYGVVRLWDKRQTRCLQVRNTFLDRGQEAAGPLGCSLTAWCPCLFGRRDRGFGTSLQQRTYPLSWICCSL